MTWVPLYAKVAHQRANQRGETLSGVIRWAKRYQTSPDKRASRGRRRAWSRNMPPAEAEHYPEGLRAVGGVIASECKRHGVCDWCVDKIAAMAGVCRSTVQTYLRWAQKLDHIEVQYRPVKGCKNLTNVIKIVSKSWLDWIKRAPVLGPIGLKPASPTKTIDSSLEGAIGKLAEAMTPPWMRRLINALETSAQPP
jgi:hypothetical protein